ncbi:hypothetical protein [Streptomyces sp. NPDC005209]|uniref:hypothetical protein n=1 Tax=Streptomyces sp. NPDC005209 TaxID=3156715 RepID=UPI0033BB1412
MTAQDDRQAASDPTPRPAPVPKPPAEDADDYSATALASHWFQRPETDTTRIETTRLDTTALDATRVDTTVADTPGATGTPDTVDVSNVSTPPDPVDGTVLRFGPGVTAALAHRLSTTPPPAAPTPPAPPAPRRGDRLRRQALPALVLIAVVVFLLCWKYGAAPVAVRDISVTTARESVGCDATADVVATVRTNGRKGTLSYRWIRNDGTSSRVLREDMARGQRSTRLHLLWTFQGRGRYGAVAELRVLSPGDRTARVHFAYDCR